MTVLVMILCRVVYSSREARKTREKEEGVSLLVKEKDREERERKKERYGSSRTWA